MRLYIYNVYIRIYRYIHIYFVTYIRRGAPAYPLEERRAVGARAAYSYLSCSPRSFRTLRVSPSCAPPPFALCAPLSVLVLGSSAPLSLLRRFASCPSPVAPCMLLFLLRLSLWLRSPLSLSCVFPLRATSFLSVSVIRHFVTLLETQLHSCACPRNGLFGLVVGPSNGEWGMATHAKSNAAEFCFQQESRVLRFIFIFMYTNAA